MNFEGSPNLGKMEDTHGTPERIKDGEEEKADFDIYNPGSEADLDLDKPLVKK